MEVLWLWKKGPWAGAMCLVQWFCGVLGSPLPFAGMEGGVGKHYSVLRAPDPSAMSHAEHLHRAFARIILRG